MTVIAVVVTAAAAAADATVDVGEGIFVCFLLTNMCCYAYRFVVLFSFLIFFFFVADCCRII